MGDPIVLLAPLVMISAVLAGIWVVSNQISSSLDRIASALERPEEKKP